MKITLFWISAIVILLSACKKKTVSPTINTSIQGTWELRATKYGNIVPATYVAGNGHLIVFGNSTYTIYLSGAVVADGIYTAATDTSYSYAAYSSAVLNPPFYGAISFRGDTLLLKPAQPDFSTSFYIKIKN